MTVTGAKRQQLEKSRLAAGTSLRGSSPAGEPERPFGPWSRRDGPWHRRAVTVTHWQAQADSGGDPSLTGLSEKTRNYP